MKADKYLELAERYRVALETAKDAFSRHYLEAMERSYRTLAESEQALGKSGRFADVSDEQN
ncbi:hypothetical protein IVB38_17040 [Bradyrhizobium sp. 38]|uniref:hypothetical protein n=1 Tax=unclassified Bradyrhizobium TaxID=2631580 RepID=UPI001FFABC0C|nr:MULTISPECIES: hypothetical protein [unclassified Bradyrhizobium]MCK1337687.1 hypothetical protein [Bradyrhizobium sp. 38]MCK1775701.1 hypothetical protein [Bradyrhizobium sp. 132]